MTPEVKFLLLIQINYEEACQECLENLRDLDHHSTGFPETRISGPHLKTDQKDHFKCHIPLWLTVTSYNLILNKGHN